MKTINRSIDEITVGAETADARQQFAGLADQWRRERGASSLAKRMAVHPAYRSIVAMGQTAVPLILICFPFFPKGIMSHRSACLVPTCMAHSVREAISMFW